MTRSITVYQDNWKHTRSSEKLLHRLAKGSILNICCGNSQLGLRADIDLKVNPEIRCDVKNLPFRELSFDTVICDPPYSMLNRFKWILKLTGLCRKRFIFSSSVMFKLSPKRWVLKNIYNVTDWGMFIRHWFVWDRLTTLKNYLSIT